MPETPMSQIGEQAALIAQLQGEAIALRAELDETNQGVLALYAELDTQAEELRQASDLKSRFLSYMSHEFRTPLGSILSIASLLSDELDGPLSPEQHKQVAFVSSSARELSDMVDDLLDLFLEEPVGQPRLYTDDKKLAQILRNFISNALKFTTRGEVRVSARLENRTHVRFAVTDTGIGIAPELHGALFEDFSQVDSPLQKRLRGTGLGLSLCKRFAGLLGGEVGVQSTPGAGSTFFVIIPLAIAMEPADET